MRAKNSFTQSKQNCIRWNVDVVATATIVIALEWNQVKAQKQLRQDERNTQISNVPF